MTKIEVGLSLIVLLLAIAMSQSDQILLESMISLEERVAVLEKHDQQSYNIQEDDYYE